VAYYLDAPPTLRNNARATLTRRLDRANAACAVIIAFVAGISAYCAGSGVAHALLVGGGAASTAPVIYLAAVTACQ
jgi:hypothetical protein